MKDFYLTNTYTGEKYKIRLYFGKYELGKHLCVELRYYDTEYDDYLPYTRLTVNFPNELKDDEAFLDVNNFPEGVRFVKENKLAKPLYQGRQNGYVIYPLYKFNLNKLKKEGVEIK